MVFSPEQPYAVPLFYLVFFCCFLCCVSSLLCSLFARLPSRSFFSPLLILLCFLYSFLCMFCFCRFSFLYFVLFSFLPFKFCLCSSPILYYSFFCFVPVISCSFPLLCLLRSDFFCSIPAVYMFLTVPFFFSCFFPALSVISVPSVAFLLYSCPLFESPVFGVQCSCFSLVLLFYHSSLS